ncbi:MAG: putative membrane protein [Roseivirga sp.]|jgi:putative membrane protein
MNFYFLFKALHIIGFVTWFAALFYLVRLFVYHREAWEVGVDDREAAVLRKQYHIMEKRLYQIIQNPALYLTLIGGTGMLIINPSWLSQPWMHIKLSLVLALVFYHFSCGRQIKSLASNSAGISSFGYRLYNEVPTLILIGIVMLAVWKSTQGLLIGLAVLLILGVLFFLAAKIYKRKRSNRID